MSFELPNLPYSHDALEPYIDKKTMEIHHGKHHAGYTNNLNNAINGTDMSNLSIEEILTSLDMNNMAVRNNGGGFFNHSLFWEIMSPNGGGKPNGDLLAAINNSFESFESFKSLSSGTITSPIFGSIVQNGKFAACALLDFVKALNKVDFPTFGRPIIPVLKPILFIPLSS